MTVVRKPSRLDRLIEDEGSSCVWCGRELWRRDLTLEHLCPRSRGGVTETANLLVACRRCNRARGARSAVAFARQREREGMRPDMAALARALEGLSASPRRAHREYAASQSRHLRALDEVRRPEPDEVRPR